ncbi:NAD-dependent protein deacylase [Elizabethkingia sp. HvH-WGS333]|uniref:SIR2 family NAD-dependent protein deacylase n=1 Tax=Elizabethkingia TaxID=308865 RepID=UPI00074160D8|nr:MULTISPECIES: NAD-dependent deacylase [Elizabethkingia]KUG13698.1 NAD-dependent deacetylase [Elizabethkingia miricola]MCL1658245.1 NAD-dependent deacylase [Elizabethkingia miricola]MCP1252811.1 NAD-dependent deacylase [Elizabethkingia sp. S0634]MDX8571587.1 NAD-dependent deacylase [Elizabethkingia sp. HX QKY]OIK46165.1 NAD-dependent protein deacylase [Elizabethkingia sp. HvH-WGS333]
MKKVVVLSGAGISAESGIKTFRDSNGLWENHKIEDVASPEGFARNPELVLEFYNLRRRQLSEVNPNEAHYILAELQKDFDVHIITQNVDDLHERAGSENIIHLHGELKKVRPVNDEESIVPWEGDLNLGDLDENGIQLRPHIVWFGEMVPEIENAATIASTADILLVIGTSLQVYPAASLLHYVPAGCEIFVIDPHLSQNVTNEKNFFKTSATEGMKLFREAIYKR